jgi:protein kinase
MEKYELKENIGNGSFGLVVKAQDKETKAIVAIKKIKQEYSSWRECLELREVKVLLFYSGFTKVGNP